MRRRAHLAAVDALQELTRQPRLSRIALSVNAAKVQKLICQRLAPVVLRKHGLQSRRELPQLTRLRPRMLLPQMFVLREQSSPPLRAFFQARQ